MTVLAVTKIRYDCYHMQYLTNYRNASINDRFDGHYMDFGLIYRSKLLMRTVPRSGVSLSAVLRFDSAWCVHFCGT